MKRTWFALALVAAIGLGCGNDDIRTYEAPKDDASRAQPGSGDLHAATPAPSSSPSSSPRVEWTVPEGWREVPGSGMRYATLLVDDHEGSLELRVTPLGLSARDPFANVNRWREQIGLEPLPASELPSVLRTVAAGDRSIQWTSMTGPAGEAQQQVLAAFLETDDAVWFFVIMDSARRVAPHEKTFESFLRSVRFTPGASMPSETPAARLVWSAPDSWVAQPADATRAAAFTIGHGGTNAEVTVTRFPGDVGGLLANVNRWRNQVGLPPVATAGEQPGQPLQVAGHPAQRFDLVADKPHDPERIIVVMFEHGGMTWFVKMTGARAVLDHHASNFEMFVNSIGFQEDS